MPSAEYYMDIAIQVGRGSKCKRAKVGSVIVDDLGRIVSTGMNGSVRNALNDKCENDHNLSFQSTLHSELNCVLFAKRDLRFCTLYCTLSPCIHCAACIIQSGITKVYYLFQYRDTSGIEFLREHGVIVKQVLRKKYSSLNQNLNVVQKD